MVPDWLWELAVVGVFTVLWALVQWKDRNRQNEIDEIKKTFNRELAEISARCAKEHESLWKKHDEDVQQLQELREQILRDHYIKPELDGRFDKLEHAFTMGLNSLGDRFDKLSNAILNFMADQPRR